MKTKYCILALLFLLFPFTLKSQIITTFAGIGTGGYSGDSGLATVAKIGYPTSGCFDRSGNYYFADRLNNRIRKIDICSGMIFTYAGNGTAGFSGDGGIATVAQLNNPTSVSIDDTDNIYISDFYNNRIRKINSYGIISTVVGTGSSGFSGDGGSATGAKLNNPEWVVVDHHNNLLISDYANYRIRRVNPSGIISTIAGNGTNGFSGDNGPADSAMISAICEGLAVDLQNNLYICDLLNYRVRKVNALTGVISTFAGNGPGSYSGDGMAATSSKVTPYALCVDKIGNIYIADLNERIRKVDTLGIISTVVGTGVSGYSGDGGMADTAKIKHPEGIAFDIHGNLFIADCQNSRIRKVKYASIEAPVVYLAGITIAPLATSVSVTANIFGAGYSYSIKWYNKGVLFATTTTPTVTYTKTMSIDSITARVYGCSDSSVSGVHVVTTGTNSHVGVREVPLAGKVQLSPNPASNTLNIAAATPLQTITITNLLGKVVLVSEQAGAKEAAIDIRNLPAGGYFVKMAGVYVGRFIKE